MSILALTPTRTTDTTKKITDDSRHGTDRRDPSATAQVGGSVYRQQDQRDKQDA